MEYKRLAGLDNQYPTISNYKSGFTDNTSVLYGTYADKNKVDFTYPSLKNLNWVKGTEFRFILVISKDTSDTNPLLYTSETFYNDLISSMNEENPYFSSAAFNANYMVQFFLSDILNTFSKTKELEKKDGILMYRNTFMNMDGSVDYDSLVAYIDWTVSKVDPLDVDNGGVLPATLLGVWDYLEIDPLTNVVSDNIIRVATTAVSGNSNNAVGNANPADKANQIQNGISQNQNGNNVVGDVLAAAGAASALVAGIKSLAGNIPKTLPTLPKIPKIPNVTDIKNMVPSLPEIPKIPSLPKLPKVPSLKLPPVPKFKPKVPKVPKKLAKGLGGLKGAIAGVTGAVAGAAGAAAAAAASAKAAADKAKAAADSAKSAVDNAKSAASSVVDNVKNNLPKL